MNSERKHSGILEILLLSLSVTGFWYYCYYLISPWIRRQNIPFRREDITPLMLKSVDQKGVEIYALYILLFLVIFSALSLSGLLEKIKGTIARRTIWMLCAAVSIPYGLSISFVPPMNSFNDTPLLGVIRQSIPIMLISFLLVFILNYLQRNFPKFALPIAAFFLAPICFIATNSISQLDYYFIFAPALRLLNGAAISDIYFQYDLLPSLLAVGWMKCGLDMNSFQIIGQAAYYMTILGIFCFSKKLFYNKQLSVYLLASLVLGRLYASPWEAVQCFQVTPVRLDFWFPFLLVVYRKGPYHWITGLVGGLLILLLKNFGTIYAIAYIQLLITLCVIDYVDNENTKSFFSSIIMYAKRCSVPVAILAIFSMVSHFALRNAVYGDYAGYYLKLGIGFMKIARDSFYWYVPVVLCTVVILLVKLRKKVSSTYLTSGFFLTYCAIGNSIYFFGRSHEHNILNIVIVLLSLFFLLLDLVSQSFDREKEEGYGHSLYLWRRGIVCVASLAIIVIIVSYSQNISEKVNNQVAIASQGRLIQPYTHTKTQEFADYMNNIRNLTDYSTKVYFIEELDFLFYYYGGYDPVGFCSPFMTWIFQKDQKQFLQGLLDSGYYLVCNKDRLGYVVDGLHYDKNVDIGTYLIISELPKLALKSVGTLE